MHTLKKLLFLLTPHERKRSVLLLLMIIIMSLLDMTGVASILPFMAVLTNPGLIEKDNILNTMFEISKTFGIENNQQFLFALGLIVFVIFIFSLTFKALTNYALIRFAQMREYTIGKRLIEGYLHQPYSWFLSRHSADLGKIILSEVQQLVSDGIRPLMELIAKGMVAFTIILLLIVVDPILTLIIGLVLTLSYLLVFYFVSKSLKRSGKKRLFNNQLRFTTINEAFGAAKEVKIGNLEQSYIKKFSISAQIYARAHTSQLVIAQIPRFILEAIAFGGILLMILYMILQTGSFNSALPIISLYVFAGYRLMPAVQQIYESFTQLTFIGPSLDKLYYDIIKLDDYNISGESKEILSFKKKISLKNIYFNYPNSQRKILRNINLSINSKSTIGIVGATGSGKTTTVDIILGLLEPQVGTLEVDGKIITKENSRSWQHLIGYVPQQIFLADDTIAANIAFGIDFESINQDAIEKASKIANLHDFVLAELPNKYQTTIGERGVKLSGGQRQRIGIARAIYHNPQLLILDEATSALDNQTERAVMDAINNLGKNITIVVIAHRLNTIKKCDKIYLLEKGKIIDEGSFEDLLKSNEDFRKSTLF